jgi:quercetin dioxygenase-like cupin family protein
MSVEAVAHYFSDGVYAKQMSLEKGHVARSHKHNYDHLSVLASGKVEIVCNGVKNASEAPSCIDIKAGIEHEIIAHEDSVFFCIHATNETDINKVDEVLIEKE